jgi:hypothetical protein
VGRAPAVLQEKTGVIKVGGSILRKLIFILFVTIWSVPVFAEDLPDTVFPWGAYSDRRPDGTERDEMRDTLGLNFINLAWDTRNPQDVIDFMNDDFYVYPNHGPIIDPSQENYYKFAEAHYSIIYANDDSSQCRFHYRNSYGSDPLYGFFPFEYVESDTPIVVLDTLWMKQEYINTVLDTLPIAYNRRLHMRIDNTGVQSTDTVAILITYNCKYGGEEATPMDSVFITGSEFSDNTPVLINCGFFNRGSKDRTSFAILTTCKTEVYFDYLKIFDVYGKDLIDDGDYDTEIMLSAANLFSGENASGWYLADEPVYDQFRPMAYIDSLIIFKTDELEWSDTARVVTAWNKTYLNLTADFINITHPEVIWPDFYPYYGGQGYRNICNGDTGAAFATDYTGSTRQIVEGRYHWGHQYALRVLFEDVADSLNAACQARSKNWWLFPQAFGHKFYSDSCKTYDDDWYARLPTKSELTCNIFMGLCCGTRGIIIWKYHGRDAVEVYSPGLLYPEGDSVTPGWYAVRDMAPYIHAIGKTYLGLTWDNAYHIGADSAMPSGVWLDTIYAVSNDTLPNPDLGWFHVGQFTKGDDKYVMIVNRACSQGPDDPDPAPSITATAKFD